MVWCAFSAGTFIHLSAFNGEYGSGVTTGQVTAAAVQALFSALAYLSALVFGIWRTLRGPLRYQAEVLACMGLGSAPGHLFGFVVFTLTGMTKGIG